MPRFPCKHPTCPALLERPGYCPSHGNTAMAQEARREANRRYDQEQRDPETKAFYDSAAWKATRETKLAMDPICERCLKRSAQHAHHKVPVKQSKELRLVLTNLMSLCHPCHSLVESRVKTNRRVTM